MPVVSEVTKDKAYRLQDIEEFEKDSLTVYLYDRQNPRIWWIDYRNERSVHYIIDHAAELLLNRTQKPCAGLWVTWIRALMRSFYIFIRNPEWSKKNLQLLESLLKQDGSTLSYVQHPDFHGIDPWVTTQRRATIYPDITMCPTLNENEHYMKYVKPHMVSDFQWFHRILLGYGNKPDSAWFPFLSRVMKPGDGSLVYYKSKNPGENLLDLADMALSLMDHEDMLAARRLKDVKYEISLKKLCRNVLYKSVPERKMALYAKELPLPQLIIDFLLLKRDLIH